MARERKGLSQEQLGRLVGVDRKTVSNWEIGKTSPRGKITQIEQALDAQIQTFTSPQSANVVVLPESATDGLTESELDELRADLQARAYTKAADIRQRQRPGRYDLAARVRADAPESRDYGEESQAGYDGDEGA